MERPRLKLSALGRGHSLDAIRSSVGGVTGDIKGIVTKGSSAKDEAGNSVRVGTVVVLKSAAYKIIGVIASGGHSRVFRCADRDGNEARCAAARANKRNKAGH